MLTEKHTSVCTLKHTPLAANTQSHTQSITVTFSHIGCFPNITYCFEQAGFLTKSASLTFSSFSFSTLQPLSSCFLPLIPFLHPLSWLFQSVRSLKSEETDGTQGLRWWKLLILEIKSTNRNRWWNKYCSFGENLMIWRYALAKTERVTDWRNQSNGEHVHMNTFSLTCFAERTSEPKSRKKTVGAINYSKCSI